MYIFSDGVYARSELVNGRWQWVIDSFSGDDFTAFVGEEREIFVETDAETEDGLFAGYVNEEE